MAGNVAQVLLLAVSALMPTLLERAQQGSRRTSTPLAEPCATTLRRRNLSLNCANLSTSGLVTRPFYSPAYHWEADAGLVLDTGITQNLHGGLKIHCLRRLVMLEREELLTVDRSPITNMSSKVRTAALAAAIIGAGVFVIGLVSGLLYEQVQRARDREHFPQIGRSVDIGGRMLNIYCSGAGQPAVIFESGATWAFYSTPKAMFENGAPRPGYIWVWIQSELAKLTTACWYDRAGSGWSDLGPYPRDSASQARDLHALLVAAEVASPYVLVAESSAALDARVYTGFYPADVAGLVLVNGGVVLILDSDLRQREQPSVVGEALIR